MRKAFDNHNNNLTTNLSNYTLILDKFAIKAFYRWSYDREINKPLVASYLFNLLNHYFSKAIVKIINIALFQAKFLLILDDKSFNQSSNFLYIDNTKIWPCSIYEHYAHRDFAFDKTSIYKYLQFISIIKQSQKQEDDYKFKNGQIKKKITFKDY